jgi:hypothetical protein
MTITRALVPLSCIVCGSPFLRSVGADWPITGDVVCFDCMAINITGRHEVIALYFKIAGLHWAAYTFNPLKERWMYFIQRADNTSQFIDVEEFQRLL